MVTLWDRVERWGRILRQRLRSVFHPSRVEDELDEELRDHLERQARALMARGMPAAEARRSAFRSFGGVEQRKEECRDTRRVALVETLLRDVRYAGRTLRQSPAFTAVAVVSLALGIGANTAIFSVVDALLVRTLPVQQPERLVALARTDGRQTGNTLPYPMLDAFRGMTDAFADVTAIAMTAQSNVTVDGPDGGSDPAQVVVALVSGSYFSTFGVRAAAGRTLTTDDDRFPGGHPVAVISDAYKRRRLPAAPDALGRALSLNGIRYAVVGVMPPGFGGDMVATPADVWIPMAMQAQVMRD